MAKPIIERTIVAMACVLMFAPGLAAQRLSDREYHAALAHFTAGEQALEAEHYDVAETEFRAAVKIDPLFDAALYGLGQVYMRTKLYERAVSAYIQSCDAFKESVASDKLDAVAADRRLRDQIKVLEDSRRVLERTSQVNRVSNVAAGIERINNQIRDLELRRNRTGADNPPPVPAGYSMALGSAYFRLNKLADAEREYRAALDVNPAFGEAHSNLAVVYMITNRLNEAEQEVKAAEKVGFKVNPQFKEDLKRRRGGTSRSRTIGNDRATDERATDCAACPTSADRFAR